MSEPVTEFIEYPIQSPFWFIDYIQGKINKRDIKGLTGGRIEAIAVSAEHPLVKLTGAFLASENANPSVAGIIPSIAVMEGTENEEHTTMGRGFRQEAYIDLAYVQGIKATFPKMEDRNREGIVTDDQIGIMESAIGRSKKGRVRAAVNHLWFRDSVTISLWTHTVMERVVLGAVLRSISFGITGALAKRQVRDTLMRTDKGLVNMNFGRILEGSETEVSFLNWARTVSVFDESPLEDSVDMENAINIVAKYLPVTDPKGAVDTGTTIWTPGT